jgi:hypothetical protein
MKSTKDTVEYVLLPNTLTAETEDDYRAHVVDAEVYSEQDLIDEMMASGAGLTRSDIAAVFEALTQAVTRVVSKGGCVRTPLFSTSFSLPGVYAADSEAPASALKLNAHPGAVIRRAAEGVPVRKVRADLAGPVIDHVRGLTASGETTDTLAAGGLVEIKGAKLKITGEGAGVFFRPVTGGAETAFTAPFGDNLPARLLFVMPALPAGVYRVIVRTRYTGGSVPGKNLREYEFPEDITVTAAA